MRELSQNEVSSVSGGCCLLGLGLIAGAIDATAAVISAADSCFVPASGCGSWSSSISWGGNCGTHTAPAHTSHSHSDCGTHAKAPAPAQHNCGC